METRDNDLPEPVNANVTREGSIQDDFGMELEPPEDGSTVQHPPNGGLRAWLIVLSCTGINALLAGGLGLLTYCLISMSNDTDIPSETLQEIAFEYLALIQMYSALAAIVMTILGYRVTIAIGACLLMVTFIIVSYLEGNEGLLKFLIYGPVAIGASFIRFGGFIPVLEYFTTKRMAALFLARLGAFIGSIVPVVIYIVMPGKITAKWRDVLRGSTGICVGIGLLGLTLKEPKLTMRDDESATFVQRTFGLFKKDIPKSALGSPY
ncbi:uncharacterized protein LOC132735429 [Ruditapes philippinarum]|uniref:uncharacterized protein LOC132735429 n=1 Tax=Ruditapes philippinarum TaxID=129788 RepID=UPI00295B9D65|nr:uncharacterized protein LOC132735429 [Ruditapes philippinarum]